MATLALIIIALIPMAEPEPKVFWVFKEPSCQPCAEVQMTIMKKWVRAQDIIVITHTQASDSEGHLVAIIRKAFPKMPIRKPANPRFHTMTIGWLWVDPASGEEVSYNASSGIYNSLRAKDLLRMIRD